MTTLKDHLHVENAEKDLGGIYINTICFLFSIKICKLINKIYFSLFNVFYLCRQAYLKKHLISHQMITDLKSSDIYRQPIIGNSSIPTYHFHNNSNFYNSHTLSHLSPHHRLYSGNIRFPHFFQNFDHRRPFNEFYFNNSNSGNRLSAFQYVHTQGIHNLNTVSSGLNGIQNAIIPTPLQVK